MKKLFTLIAAALVAVGASAQTDFGTLSVVGNKVIEGSEADWDVAFTGSEMTSNGDGTYTFVRENATLEAGTKYEYKIVQNHSWDKPNLNWGDTQNLNSDGQPGNLTIQVSETAVYTITINFTPTEDPLTAQVPSVTTVKTGSAGEISHIYTVAGVIGEAVTGWSADNAANDMTLDTDEDSENFGLYTFTAKDVNVDDSKAQADGSYNAGQFKVTVDHAWGVAYPTDNYNINVPQTGKYDILITFDPTSKAVNATATRTGDAGEVTHTYVVAGDEAILGENWSGSSTANAMTLGADGKYTLTKSNVAIAEAKTYGYKVVLDGATWIPGGDNLPVEISEAGVYEIVFTFDPTTQEATATATKTGVLDGIEAVKTVTVKTNGDIFNLAGQKVSKDFKGIVISNGKKYIQK